MTTTLTKDRCLRCNEQRLATVQSKASDMHFVCIGEVNYVGYLPRDMGIGGGDFCQITYCLNCGQIQNEFPLPETRLEKGN